MRLGTVAIVVKPPRDTDWRGDPAGDQESPDFRVEGCKKWPGQMLEQTFGGEDVSKSKWIWVPPGQPAITELDQVVIVAEGDRPYAVFSSAPYENGRGVDKGQVIGLIRRGTRP